jgi:hypothetical protein
MGLETGPTVAGRDSESRASTDLYQLWQKAFASYNSNIRGSNSKTAVSIETLPRIRTLDGVIAQVDQASREWSIRRHNQGRLDRLRSAVAEYLGLAQTVGDLVVQSAVAVQPISKSIAGLLLTAVGPDFPTGRCHMDGCDICYQGIFQSAAILKRLTRRIDCSD